MAPPFFGSATSGNESLISTFKKTEIKRFSLELLSVFKWAFLQVDIQHAIIGFNFLRHSISLMSQQESQCIRDAIRDKPHACNCIKHEKPPSTFKNS